MFAVSNEAKKEAKELRKEAQKEPNHILAILLYKEAAKKEDYSSSATYFQMAERQEALTFFDDAILSYVNALQLQPKHYSAYHGLGACFQQQLEFDSAIRCYREAFTMVAGLYNFKHLNPHQKRKTFVMKDMLKRKLSVCEDFYLKLPADHIGRKTHPVVIYLLGEPKEPLQIYNQPLSANNKTKRKATTAIPRQQEKKAKRSVPLSSSKKETAKSGNVSR